MVGMRAAACLCCLLIAAAAHAQTPQPLRWGGDAEGGAPFVEANPADPSIVAGFDVEIAEHVAARLGRPAQFIQIAFQSLDQSAKRGDFDIGLSGIEDIPARRQSLAASVPYYEFREVLTVRAGDRDRYRTLADLGGRRVATLGGTMAYDLLLEAERTHGLTAVSYDEDVHPYTDLAMGRVDAVVLDHVLAERAMRRNTGLFTHADALATGHYIIITAPENTALRDQVDAILRDAMRDGTLERILHQPVRREGLYHQGESAGAGSNLGALDAAATPHRSGDDDVPEVSRADQLHAVPRCCAVATRAGVVQVASPRHLGSPSGGEIDFAFQ